MWYTHDTAHGQMLLVKMGIDSVENSRKYT